MRRGSLSLLLLLLLSAAAGHAATVEIFRLQSQSSFLRGKLEGVSVDALGTLRLAPRAERLTALAEPFVLSAASHPDGWVIGTGNAGKVLLVARDGQVRELFATAEPEVFAVWAAADGTVFAGSSPNGKVYRWRPGHAGAAPAAAEVWFEPGETYVWQLAGTADGALLAATGTQGKLFRIAGLARDGKGTGEVLWDSDDTHVRSVAVLPDGAVLAGTAGEGRIVRLDQGRRPRTLHDGAHPEVVAIATQPDGTAWAAVVASEASAVPLAAPGTPPAQAEGKQGEAQAEGGGAAEETVVVTVGEPTVTPQPAGTRPPGFQGARSEILRIAPSGTTEVVTRLQDDTVHALLWQGERLWIGTGTEGKVYTLAGKELVLANDVEERQVMALLPAEPAPVLATTNAAAVYRLLADERRAGTYTSPVLDAGQIARFGVFRWLGEAPAGARVAFSFRGGIAAEPDATWSSWSEARSAEGASREIPLDDVPSARYFQWRAQLSAPSGATPAISAAEVSYRQENLAPRITELAALDPGQILVAYNFNPTNQVYEPAHPNREGIFTTLEQPAEGGDDRLKPLWKKGFRTLRWKAEDPNRDALTFRLTFRPEGGGTWLPMALDLEDSHYSFDETALPDGVYRFRLEASDADDEEPGRALADERISEPVVVDHTPPRLVGVRRDGDRLVVELADDGNPLREAEYSAAGGAWKAPEVRDGLLDGRREELVVPAPAARGTNGGGEAALLILRVTDAAFNVVTFDLSREAVR